MFKLIQKLFRKKQPSLLALSIHWTNNVKWVPRLIAYRQLEDWLSYKHTNENQTD